MVHGCNYDAWCCLQRATNLLKAGYDYTFGNCSRQVFWLGVSQHLYKITNLRESGLNWSSKLKNNNERKTPVLHIELQDACEIISSSKTTILENFFVCPYQKDTLPLKIQSDIHNMGLHEMSILKGQTVINETIITTVRFFQSKSNSLLNLTFYIPL